MKILVTGGAGYIGSHMVTELLRKKHSVTVFDNLSGGHKKAIPDEAPIYIGDTTDSASLYQLLSKHKFDAVLHFAGVISMGESVQNPGKYFRINTFGALTLFEALVKHNIKKVIFSSTAGVYGNPIHIPIPEDDPKNPTNPYGESKLMVEKILEWYDLSFGLKFVSLRYFNAAGASLDGTNGEDHREETHIIPIAIKAALKGKTFIINGSDYPTKDGTAIRDYIHVVDLVDAHILALEYLSKVSESAIYNVGTGFGHSNKEVVEIVKKVTKVDFKVKYGPRRPGDANELIAQPIKIKKDLGWQPRYSDLETIVKTAYNWHKNHPNGFND
jgi:UDP-glucose 4-epimerase